MAVAGDKKPGFDPAAASTLETQYYPNRFENHGSRANAMRPDAGEPARPSTANVVVGVVLVVVVTSILAVSMLW